MARSLLIEVFNSGYKPIPGGPGWDDSTPATWPASTSTLIARDRDAVLVDALLTTSEGQRLAAWVRNTGKRTPGDLRNRRSRRPLLRGRAGAGRFPRPDHPQGHGVLELPVHRAVLPLPRAALASSPELDLDGHPLLFRPIGGAKGVLATIVHVPEVQTICSGDIAYNNIHMWLWNSTPDSRQAWLASPDAVAALEPSTIITGHKDPDAPDDNATRVLDQSRRYIQDFGQTLAKSSTPRELIDAMLTKYPAYGNRYTLFAAAFTQFPS